MDEMYILHELHGDSFHETEASQEPEAWQEPLPETVPEPTPESTHDPQVDPIPITESNLVFVPIEEPSTNWEMELAQAYVRAQPLEGVFSPEEGLRMGTAFPNLSQPYESNWPKASDNEINQNCFRR
ncbi:MAG: spore coat associated protein CotJA [Defluviitaleaceae bacterium]|nr:spore coat associated protein CotJA [Defluviitaleaceae bacterium]